MVIVCTIAGGNDAFAEEMWYNMGRYAHERGYNVLLIDGPGQGSTLRINR